MIRIKNIKIFSNFGKKKKSIIQQLTSRRVSFARRAYHVIIVLSYIIFISVYLELTFQDSVSAELINIEELN